MIGAVYRAELRANRLALAALPALSMAMYGGIRYLQYIETSRTNWHRSILDDAFIGVVYLAMAITALGIGVLHPARDTSQGAWAFLMHRPATPGQILLGKLASALTIYFAVVAPPLLAAILWAATPGHLPGPWEWGMAVPAMVDLFSATLYIVVGMLIVLREARWFGTRLFPLLAAVICTIATWSSSLPVAICVIPIGWAILLAATWSAMATRDRPSIQRWPARLATSIVLIPASIFVPAIAAAIINEYLRPPAAAYDMRQYVLSDGQVLDCNYPAIPSIARVVVSPQDQVLAAAPASAYKPREDRMQSTTLHLTTDLWHYRAYSPNYHVISHYFAADTGSSENGVTIWYYSFSKAYFIFYKRPLRGDTYITGYIGRNGTSTTLAQVEPFAPGARLSSSFGTFVIEPQRVYEAHTTEHSGPIFTAPPGEICRDASYLFAYSAKPEDTRTNYVVITDKAIYMVGPDWKQFVRVPHAADKPIVDVAITPDPNVYMALYRNEPYMGGSAVFIRFRADGTKLAQTELPQLRPPLQTVSRNSDLPMAVLVPPFAPAVDAVMPPPRGLALILGQSVVSGLVALLVLRRLHVSRRILTLWVIVALLAGVSGLILMAGTRQWPLLLRCPACGKQRRASMWRCDHCDAEYPAPNPGPVGIFDSANQHVHA